MLCNYINENCADLSAQFGFGEYLPDSEEPRKHEL